MYPDIIDILERYSQVTQTLEEREEGIIILEPTNKYTQKTLYLPFQGLEEYLHNKLLEIEHTHEVSFTYGCSLLECLFNKDYD